MSRRVSPDFKTCQWCGEQYEMLHGRQRSHAQSEWCMQQQKREKEHRVHRKLSAQKAERRKERVLKTKVLMVNNPFALAVQTLRRCGFGWLYERHKDDCRQELSLILLRMGICDFTAPTEMDVALLSRVVLREMHRVNFEITGRKQGNSPTLVVSDKAIEHKARELAESWQAVWRAA